MIGVEQTPTARTAMRPSLQPKRLAASHRHCAAVVRASGSSFASTFWLFPKAQRRALHAIYAFCRMADDLADDPRIRGDRRRLIGEWRDELDRVFAGVPRSLVGPALCEAAERFDLDRAPFAELLDGVESDLDAVHFASFEDVERYCHHVASTVGLMVLAVRGVRGEVAERYASDLGIAVQLTNIVRDVREDAHEGRCYLAQQDMERFAVEPRDLMDDACAEPLRVLLASYAERARIRFERAERALPNEYRAAVGPARAMGAVYRAQLEHLRAGGYEGPREGRRLARGPRLWAATKGFLGRGALA